MAQFLQREEIQVEIGLEEFDGTDSERQDSPVGLDTSSGEFCAEEMTVSNEISINMNQLSVKTIDSQLNLTQERESNQLKQLLRKLNLSDRYNIRKLSRKDIEIFDFMNTDMKNSFNFSLSTVHLGFTLYLQFSDKIKCSPIPTAISCLLGAAKFNESQYDVPFIEEILKLVPREDKVTYNIIKRQELMVLVENDWNLLQTTLWKSGEYLLAYKKDLQKGQEIIESDIGKGGFYAIPKEFNSIQEIYDRENSIYDIGFERIKSEIEIVRRRVKKKHSQSVFMMDENLKCINELTLPPTNFLEVPKKSKKKRRRSKKSK